MQISSAAVTSIAARQAKPFWLVTHNGEHGVSGRSFQAGHQAIIAYEEADMMRAHMVIGPGGVILKFYGVSVFDLRSEMRLWYQDQVKEKFTCCHRGHVLMDCRGTGHRCDSCTRTISGAEAFFACYECTYDLCGQCGSRRAGEYMDEGNVEACLTWTQQPQASHPSDDTHRCLKQVAEPRWGPAITAASASSSNAAQQMSRNTSACNTGALTTSNNLPPFSSSSSSGTNKAPKNIDLLDVGPSANQLDLLGASTTQFPAVSASSSKQVASCDLLGFEAPAPPTAESLLGSTNEAEAQLPLDLSSLDFSSEPSRAVWVPEKSAFAFVETCPPGKSGVAFVSSGASSGKESLEANLGVLFSADSKSSAVAAKHSPARQSAPTTQGNAMDSLMESALRGL